MKKVFAELGETAGKHVAETEAKARAMEAAEEEARKFALEEGGKAGINTYKKPREIHFINISR